MKPQWIINSLLQLNPLKRERKQKIVRGSLINAGKNQFITSNQNNRAYFKSRIVV